MHPIDKTRGLTADKLRNFLSYDPETGVFRWLKRAQNVFIGDIAGYCHPDSYRRINIEHSAYSAHRLAWLYMTGKWPTNQIDHINGIKDDNRFANLRPATSQQNRRNSRAKRETRSGIKGVIYQPNARTPNKYRAMICENYKVRHIGNFATAEEAAQAYQNEATKTFGPFAHHLSNEQ